MHPRRRHAFTLVEVLLSIGLILALAASLFAYIHGLVEQRTRLVLVADQQAAAAALFEELESDLATTFAADASGDAGVKGDGSSITVRCRAVPGRTGTGAVTDFGDLLGSEMRFSSGKLSARRLGKSQRALETVASGIERLRFRYFNGVEWLETFDSAQTGELPVAVEAALWFGETTAPNDEPANSSEVLREPDRLRVMVVPDGPVTAWKSGE